MLSLIQAKSGLGKENLEKDIEYIDGLTKLTIYDYGYDRLNYNFYNVLLDVDNLSHIHLDPIAISRITDEKIEYWNSKFTIVLRKTSQLKNDIEYITKNYADIKIRKFIIDKNIIFRTNEGKSWSLKVDDYGVLYTEIIE